MTNRKTRIQPSIEDIESGVVEKPYHIRVETDSVKNITLNSEWTVDYDTNIVTLKMGKVTTRFGETLLIPLDVPNRHIRNARRVAATLFNLKRFDNLLLYKACNPQALYLAMRENEPGLFAKEDDALLWCSQGDEDFAFIETSAKEVSFGIMTELSEKEVIEKAQQNSALVRAEVLNVLVQASAGVRAFAKLIKMLKKGVQPKILEGVWEEVYERNDMPNAVRQFIREKKKAAKKERISKKSS